MKNIITTLSILFCFQSFAQITLGGNSIYSAGDQFIVASDSSVFSTLTPGSAGPNQTWDFSDLNESYLDTLNVFDPALTPFFNEFPTATTALLQDSSYLYGNVSNNEFRLLGSASIAVNNGGFANLPFSSREFKFPFNYLDTINLRRSFSFTADGALFQLPFDSVRISFNSTGVKTADAWGNVIIGNTSNNCLRLKEETTDEFIFEGYISFINSWTPLSGDTSQSIIYTYMPENLGYAFVTLNVNENNEVTFAEFVKEFTPSSVSKVISDVEVKVFPNPASDLLFLKTKEHIEGEIEIDDVQGRKVLTQGIEGKNAEVQISSFNSGIYILKLRDNNGLVLKQSKFSIIK